MKAEEKQQLIERIQEIRFSDDNEKSIVIAATSGKIVISNSYIINNILDALLRGAKTMFKAKTK